MCTCNLTLQRQLRKGQFCRRWEIFIICIWKICIFCLILKVFPKTFLMNNATEITPVLRIIVVKKITDLVIFCVPHSSLSSTLLWPAKYCVHTCPNVHLFTFHLSRCWVKSCSPCEAPWLAVEPTSIEEFFNCYGLLICRGMLMGLMKDCTYTVRQKISITKVFSNIFY